MSEFATLMTQAIQKQAEQDGVNLITMDAKNDPATQLTQVDNLINQKVDALLVAAVDVGSMVQGVEAANKAKNSLCCCEHAYTHRRYKCRCCCIFRTQRCAGGRTDDELCDIQAWNQF